MSQLPPLFSDDFPSHYRECYCGVVDVFWYHPAFAQSRYPPGQEGSEACTLICLLVAQRISKNGIVVWDVDECQEMIVTIAEAIIEGNETHSWIMKRGLVPYAYLNTEEALQYGGKSLRTLKEWKFRVYHEDIGCGLYRNVQSHLSEWYREPKGENLFMLLITSGRTILFIFQESTFKVTLFDSHTHNAAGHPPRGLVIAQASINDFDKLCEWYVHHVLIRCYRIQPDQYELAFVHQIRRIKSSCGHAKFSCNCRGQ